MVNILTFFKKLIKLNLIIKIKDDKNIIQFFNKQMEILKNNISNDCILQTDMLYNHMQKINNDHQKEIYRLNNIIKNIEEEKSILYNSNQKLIEEIKYLKIKCNDILISEKELNSKNNIDICNFEIENIKLEYEIKSPKKKNTNECKNVNNNIHDKCPVYIYINPNTKLKRHIANETNLKIIYNKELKEIMEFDNINIDEAVDYIIKNRNIKDTSSSRQNYKNKIERCRYLDQNYGNKLNVVFFSISKVSRLSKKEWELWLIYFNKKIKDLDLKIS